MKIDCEYSMKINLEVIVSDSATKDEIDNLIREEGKKRLRYYLSGYMFDPSGKILTDEIKFKNTKYASI